MLMVMDRREAMEIDVTSALLGALVATARRTFARAALLVMRPALNARLRRYASIFRGVSIAALDPTGRPGTELERWASDWERTTRKLDHTIAVGAGEVRARTLRWRTA